MITVYYGKDEFRAHEALAELRAGLDTDDMLADNTTRVDGDSAKPDELLAACQTVPFLSARRLVIVHGLLGRFETPQGRARGRRRAAALGPWEGFIAGLEAGLPETTALVFIDGVLSPGNPFLKALPKDAARQEFVPLKQSDVAAWIMKRAERYGVTLEGRAVASLASLVGSQLGVLDSELQKLAAYAGGRPVTEADVRELVSFAREPNVFALADAAIEGRPRDAVDLLQRLLAEGEPPQRLLTMIARQYRLLMLTRELLASRVRAPEIAARLGVHPFVAQRLVKQAPAYTPERLRRAYRMLLDADLSIKRGQFDEETALQLLLVELATLQQTRPARAS